MAGKHRCRGCLQEGHGGSKKEIQLGCLIQKFIKYCLKTRAEYSSALFLNGYKISDIDQLILSLII